LIYGLLEIKPLKQIIDPIEFNQELTEQKEKWDKLQKQVNKSNTEKKPQTVKFKAFDLIKDAETKLQEAIDKLNECMALEGDNESQIFCESLISSITKDKNTLHRGRIEADEMW
jgi:hypothetical protein